MHVVSQSLSPLISAATNRPRCLTMILTRIMIAGGCATGKGKTSGTAAITGTTWATDKVTATTGKAKDSVTDVRLDADKRHEWLGRTFASVVDATNPLRFYFEQRALFKFSGLGDRQLVGQNMALGELLYYTNLSKKFHVGGGLETGRLRFSLGKTS